MKHTAYHKSLNWIIDIFKYYYDKFSQMRFKNLVPVVYIYIFSFIFFIFYLYK